MKSKFYCILFTIASCTLSGYSQVISTIAGIGAGASSGDGYASLLAHIPNPVGGYFDTAGNYYFGESFSNPRVRKISPTGIITTVAGTGVTGFSGDDSAATLAKFSFPSIFVDRSGYIYIADRDNHRIRIVDCTTGIITTIAGTGAGGFNGDGGMATLATLYPFGLCVDKVGNIYINDSAVRIRKIDGHGIISTIAGTGVAGYSGDNGNATAAQLAMNYDLCMDPSDSNLFIGCATYIRKINIYSNIITRFAGNGVSSYSGDEIPATDASFSEFGIYSDGNNDLFISDYGNERIRKIDVTGTIHTVAGTGIAGYSGDSSPATDAEIYYPEGIITDPCGNLYIADEANNRIRKITYPPVLTTPAISLSGIVAAPMGSAVTLTASVSSAGSSYIIHWLNHGVEFTTTTVPAVTYTKPPGIDTITARIVPTGYGCYDSTISTAWYVAVGATGISGTTAAGISIYPNPAQNMLTIAAMHPIASISISNIMGQVVTLPQPLAQAPAALSYNIGGLAPGMYIITVTDEQGNKKIAKFVKE